MIAWVKSWFKKKEQPQVAEPQTCGEEHDCDDDEDYIAELNEAINGQAIAIGMLEKRNRENLAGFIDIMAAFLLTVGGKLLISRDAAAVVKNQNTFVDYNQDENGNILFELKYEETAKEEGEEKTNESA